MKRHIFRVVAACVLLLLLSVSVFAAPRPAVVAPQGAEGSDGLYNIITKYPGGIVYTTSNDDGAEGSDGLYRW